MKRRDRIYFLLAAGISLGVHATAAVYLTYTAPTLDGLNQPPTQIVQLSLVTQRAATPAVVPDPAPEAAPAPVKRKPPTPRPRPVSPRVQPERTLPTPAPETAVSLPLEPVTTARMESTQAQQPAAAAATASAQESYLARLLAHIDSHKFYPRGARRRGQEGDVHVQFYLLQDGGIRALDVSGGNRQLREAAERAVQAALPLPQPPASINLQEQFSFSMQYRLKG
jgi:periplasmic protein TonB